MVGTAEGITGIFVGQGNDPVDNLADSPALLVGHFFAGRVCRRADTYRYLGALWERGPGLEHDDTVLDAGANDHKAFIGREVASINGASALRPRKDIVKVRTAQQNESASMGPPSFNEGRTQWVRGFIP
jgi:hypothetical protein